MHDPPQDVLVLSVLGRNSIADGDDFRDDGYIYNQGKKTRKWFSSLGEHRTKYFWKPCLQNAARIEALLHRLLLRRENVWQRMEKVFEQVVAVSEPVIRHGQQTWLVHAKPTHCGAMLNEDPKNYWVFHLRKSNLAGETGCSFSNNWIVEPTTKILPELGQQFYQLTRYYHDICYRVGLIRAILFEAIKKDIDTKHGLYGSKRRTFQYVINDRNHWLREELNRSSVPILEWMPDPGGVIQERI